MKKLISLTLTLLFSSVAFAQEPTVQDTVKNNNHLEKYRRSYLYTVLIRHSTFPYGEQIDSAFISIPIPDKFNDHNLGLRAFESSAKKQKKKGKDKVTANESDINDFITSNDIPKLLVSQWFNRCDTTGVFNMELVQSRGFYDASQQAINLADNSILGRSILADAGEDLIGKTFMLINDITYVDKGATSAKVGGVLSLIGKVAAVATNDDSYSAAGDAAGALVNEIDGFTVNVVSYLYKLDWDDEIAATFYDSYWVDSTFIDSSKILAFDTCGMFNVRYLGSTTISAGNFASKSFAKSNKMKQMSKVCARAIDKSIVELQRAYEEFKVNTPISHVNEDGTIEAFIGLKEGINSKSVYEILIPEDKDGKIRYVKVGKARPVVGKIWDNRYGALDDALLFKEEGETPKDAEAHGSDPFLKATLFNVDGSMRKKIVRAHV